MSNSLHRTTAVAALVCAASFAIPLMPPVSRDGALDDRALSFALCPIVYQVDNVPGPRGYHYLFYGNAFFINRDGYLLTAAHVLSQLHGAQPAILLRVPYDAAHPDQSGPRFVPTSVIALDRDHDVAILRATPNPFDGPFRVSTLPLAHQPPAPGRTVVLAALRPFRPRDSYTLDSALEERSPGGVLAFEFSQLEKGRADTELFLFSHRVEPGQSGAPVISPDTQQVLGLVEGQWLRTSLAAKAAPSSTPIPGAVIPIHYALALLQQKGIAWQSSPDDSVADLKLAASDHAGAENSAPPAPLSLVPAPYPAQSLFGGEVILDALVTRSGLLADVKLIHGDSPFAEKALAAVRTWTFTPPRNSSADQRISIIFEFPQPYSPPRRPTTHHHDEELSEAPHTPATSKTNAALPLVTVEPAYPADTLTSSGAPAPAEGSVIFYGIVNREGQLASTEVVQDLPPFTATAQAAARQWRFAPAAESSTTDASAPHASSGVPERRATILVFTFRRALQTQNAK